MAELVISGHLVIFRTERGTKAILQLLREKWIFKEVQMEGIDFSFK